MGRPEPTTEADSNFAAEAALLAARYGDLSTEDLLRRMITETFQGRIALVSSFGAEAAVLLHMVAAIDPATPILFVDTEKLFPETLAYRDLLTERFGLTDVRVLKPDPARIASQDKEGYLWFNDRDRCCHIRKVEPLALGIAGFDAWISGRKRFQAATRATIPLIEAEGHQFKINPLAAWGPKELQAYADLHQLPPHPLVAQGYPSIGCMPCTDKVAPGEDARAGRWRGAAKVECGIHLGLIGGAVDEGMGI